MWMGSLAESGALKLSYSRSRVGFSAAAARLSRCMGSHLKSAIPDRQFHYHRRMRRLLLRAGMAVLLLVIVAVFGGYTYLRQSLPDYSGEATVTGLTAPVDIVRDGDAIPHVFA